LYIDVKFTTGSSKLECSIDISGAWFGVGVLVAVPFASSGSIQPASNADMRMKKLKIIFRMYASRFLSFNLFWTQRNSLVKKERIRK
jgi:hypothetical protein